MLMHPAPISDTCIVPSFRCFIFVSPLGLSFLLSCARVDPVPSIGPMATAAPSRAEVFKKRAAPDVFVIGYSVD